ncbi:MAG: hypothetical protein HY917_02925 [Candidatus Diapherotrites archaeon]|nr:hypothetical protein [Candidatus Diapherotrites archaeon]
MPSSVRRSKSVNVFSLRRLGNALRKNPKLGLAIRGTSWAETKNVKKTDEIFHPEGRTIYMQVAPAHVGTNRETVRQLRAALLYASRFSMNGKRLFEWRNWKAPKDFPAIVIIGKAPNYRGWMEPETVHDYSFRDRECWHVELKAFPKDNDCSVPGSQVLATVRPTKKEMAELEQSVVKNLEKKLGRNLQSYDHVARAYSMSDAFDRLMVNKAARVIVKAYRKELKPTK